MAVYVITMKGKQHDRKEFFIPTGLSSRTGLFADFGSNLPSIPDETCGISDYSSGPIADWAGQHVDIAQWGLAADETWPVEIEATGTFLTGGLYDSMVTYHIECTYAEGFRNLLYIQTNSAYTITTTPKMAAPVTFAKLLIARA